MLRIRAWLITGAVVPAALISLAALVVAVAMGPDGAVQTLGVALMMLMMLIPVGTLVGGAIGLLVLWLGRRIPPRGAQGRRPYLIVGAAVVHFCAVCGGLIGLRMTASDGISPWSALLMAALFAIVPTTAGVVTWVRQGRRSQSAPPPSASGSGKK